MKPGDTVWIVHRADSNPQRATITEDGLHWFTVDMNGTRLVLSSNSVFPTVHAANQALIRRLSGRIRTRTSRIAALQAEIDSMTTLKAQLEAQE